MTLPAFSDINSFVKQGAFMPQRKSAKKELRKNLKRRQRNLKVKKAVKAAVKEFKKSLLDKNPDERGQALKNLCKTLDKAAQKKVIHPNKAARKKSRAAKMIEKS